MRQGQQNFLLGKDTLALAVSLLNGDLAACFLYCYSYWNMGNGNILTPLLRK